MLAVWVAGVFLILGLNIYYRPVSNYDREIRFKLVDCSEKYKVHFKLRPNTGRACWASPDRIRVGGARTFTTEQWIPHSPRPGR